MKLLLRTKADILKLYSGNVDGVSCFTVKPTSYRSPISFLLRAKLIDVTLALNATRFLSNEKQYLPWESAERNIKYFILMFDRTEVYGPMQACVI